MLALMIVLAIGVVLISGYVQAPDITPTFEEPEKPPVEFTPTFEEPEKPPVEFTPPPEEPVTPVIPLPEEPVEPPEELITIELISPEYGAVIDTLPTFEWTPIDTTGVSYNLAIWKLPKDQAERITEGYKLTEADFVDLELVSITEPIMVTTFTPDHNGYVLNLAPDFTYGWQVEARLGDREIDRSAIWSFNVSEVASCCFCSCKITTIGVLAGYKWDNGQIRVNEIKEYAVVYSTLCGRRCPKEEEIIVWSITRGRDKALFVDRNGNEVKNPQGLTARVKGVRNGGFELTVIVILSCKNDATCTDTRKKSQGLTVVAGGAPQVVVPQVVVPQVVVPQVVVPPPPCGHETRKLLRTVETDWRAVTTKVVVWRGVAAVVIVWQKDFYNEWQIRHCGLPRGHPGNHGNFGLRTVYTKISSQRKEKVGITRPPDCGLPKVATPPGVVILKANLPPDKH